MEEDLNYNQMVILVNASNLKQGGGIQVAQSIIGQLHRFQTTRFIVVLSNAISISAKEIGKNTEVIRFDMPNSFSSILFGMCKFLDDLVENRNVDAVLTIFGPSRWRPRVPHLCGFARAQLILTDSPYYQRISIKERVVYKLWTWLFRKSSDTFYTENAFISERLPQLLGNKCHVYTVTNYYNQIFDLPESWKRTRILAPFDGVTVLSISSHYPHKNFEILIGVSRYLREYYPDSKFRFVLTFDESEMLIPDDVGDSFVFIGKVEVSECPYLYEQSDIMFMPTLLECFSATYPEAMRMGVPIVTTDLMFAHSLCGDAACYYSAVDVVAAAEALHKVATDRVFTAQLVANGKEQLKKFDNYEQRAEKLVGLLESIVEQ